MNEQMYGVSTPVEPMKRADSPPKRVRRIRRNTPEIDRYVSQIRLKDRLNFVTRFYELVSQAMEVMPTQTALGTVLDVDSRNVSNWARGKAVNISTALKYTEALKVVAGGKKFLSRGLAKEGEAESLRVRIESLLFDLECIDEGVRCLEWQEQIAYEQYEKAFENLKEMKTEFERQLRQKQAIEAELGLLRSVLKQV